MDPTQQTLPDVMLLSAGLGRRMRPLTDTVPKPLIPVGGIAMLDRVVANARAEGLLRFVLNCHHLRDQIVNHVERMRRADPDAQFELIEEPELLETGGGVRNALAQLRTDPFLVMNTDAFWPKGADAPIARMIAAFEAGGADMVLLCAQPRRAIGFRRSHDFCLAPDGLVTNDRGAPVIYAGVALMGRAVFEHAPQGPFSLSRLMDEAIEAETLRGVVLDAPWLHVGDVQALAEAEAALAS